MIIQMKSYTGDYLYIYTLNMYVCDTYVFIYLYIHMCTYTHVYDNENIYTYMCREYVDISVAVSSPTGLVVPVLRNTNNMDFADVEKAISFYGKKAKDGQLALEDMTGIYIYMLIFEYV
jgi:hypothetical protein